MKKLFLVLFGVCTVAGLSGADLIFYPEYHYTYIPLPIPTQMAGYLDLEPQGINNNNQVVGTGFVPGYGGPEAFISSGGKTQMYTFPSAYLDCLGFGINDAGTIVGEGTTATGEHALYALFGHAAVDIDGNPQRNSSAKTINNNGYFAGKVNNQPALGSTTSGWISTLGATLGNDFYITQMNDNLALVGYGHLGGAIYDIGSGTVTQLSSVLGTLNNKATAINQAGVVAGTLGNVGFVYSNGAVTLFGNNILSVNGINAKGNIVGTLTNGHGFICSGASHTITDLNSLVGSEISNTWTIAQATGINDHDTICGIATRPAKSSDSANGWYGTVYQGFTMVWGTGLGIVLPKNPFK